VVAKAFVDLGRIVILLRPGPGCERALTLRHLVDILVRDQVNPPLEAGEIVTTGTLTRALPISGGDTWTTELTGVRCDGICVIYRRDICSAPQETPLEKKD
jgi:2-oxo-3-hexenedioate decarboxylase